MLPLSRNYFNASIVKIMENCGLSNGLYFVSTDLVCVFQYLFHQKNIFCLYLEMFYLIRHWLEVTIWIT